MSRRNLDDRYDRSRRGGYNEGRNDSNRENPRSGNVERRGGFDRGYGERAGGYDRENNDPRGGYNRGNNEQRGGYNRGGGDPRAGYDRGDNDPRGGYDRGDSDRRGGYDRGNSDRRGGYDRGDSDRRGGYDRGDSDRRGGYDRGDSDRRGGYDRGDSDRRGGYDRGDSDRRGGYDRGDSNRRGGYDRRGDGDRGGYRGGGSGGYRGGDSRGGRGFSSRPLEEAVDISTLIEKLAIDKNLDEENVIIPDLGEMYGDMKTGKIVDTVSNYFCVSQSKNTNYSQYTVQFDPEIENRRMKEAMLKVHIDLIGKAYTFDGLQLFLTKKLSDNVTVIYSDINTYVPKKIGKDDVGEVIPSTSGKIKITITYIKSVDGFSPTVIQILNLKMRRIFRILGYNQIKRHFYNHSKRIIMENDGLEIWPGLALNFVPFGDKLSICADITYHVVLRETVLDRLAKLHQRFGAQNVVDEAKKDLLGKVVMTRYNNSTYRIDDIDFNQHVDGTFTLSTGETISYIKYYQDRYGITIKDKNQPLIISIPKKKRESVKKGEQVKLKIDDVEVRPVCLVPELCIITGMSEEMRQNMSLNRAVADCTRLSPTERSKQLCGFINSIYENEETAALIDMWGVKLRPKLMTIPSRVMEPEKVFAADQNKTQLENMNTDWTRSIKNLQFQKSVQLKNWAFLYPAREKAASYDFLNMLTDICGKMGFHISKPISLEVSHANATSYNKMLHDVTKNGNIQFTMCVLESNKKDVYDAIKRKCYSEIGIGNQVMVARTIKKKQGLASVATKVGIQINVKLGGEAWYVSIPLKDVMIVGIDVCHDPQSRSNSYGAFVASMNNTCSRYFSLITKQHVGQEIIDSLASCLRGALYQYQVYNKKYPSRIIIFRDGVGDGQLTAVKNHELIQMKKVLEDINIGDTTKLAMIIVKKRISTRLFMVGQSNLGNPQPGTVVDRHITRDEYPNFFLISQNVTQGTVNPTHYLVLHNETKIKTDHLQRLAYKLTHLYYNWSGTIRVPAPCQYAHKLCFIASNSIRNLTQENLSNYLYYL